MHTYFIYLQNPKALADILIKSKMWNADTKIILFWEQREHGKRVQFLDVLKELNDQGIFNVAILLPKVKSRPCKLVYSSPNSDQLQTTINPRGVNPKQGRKFYNLNRKDLLISYSSSNFPLIYEKNEDLAGAWVAPMKNLVREWNATYHLDHNYNDIIGKFNRSEIGSRLFFVPGFLTKRLLELNLDWCINPKPDFIVAVLCLHPIKSFYSGFYKFFINIHSLAVVFVFLTFNIIFLWCSPKSRIDWIRQFIETLPLCFGMSGTARRDAIPQRVLFVAFFCTYFFLNQFFSCNLTSKMVEYHYNNEDIKSVGEAMELHLPIALDKPVKVGLGLLGDNETEQYSNFREFDRSVSETSEEDMVILFFWADVHKFFSDKSVIYGDKIFQQLSHNLTQLRLGYFFPIHSPFISDFCSMLLVDFETSTPVYNESTGYFEKLSSDTKTEGDIYALQQFQMTIALKLLTAGLLISISVFIYEVVRGSTQVVENEEVPVFPGPSRELDLTLSDILEELNEMDEIRELERITVQNPVPGPSGCP